MPDTIPKVLLAFDFGLKKIGVAVGQTITQSASPLAVIKAINGNPDWQEIQSLVKVWRAQGFVVGLPYQLDGSEQPVSIATRRFADKLESRFHLPVFLVDERYTTRVARIEYGKESNIVDSYSAKLILESWFRLQQKSTR